MSFVLAMTFTSAVKDLLIPIVSLRTAAHESQNNKVSAAGAGKFKENSQNILHRKSIPSEFSVV